MPRQIFTVMADEDYNHDSEAIYGNSEYDHDSEAIYGNSESILFHQLTMSGQLLGDIGNTDETEDEQEESHSDFSDDEDWPVDTSQLRIQPEEDENVEEVQEENIQDTTNKRGECPRARTASPSWQKKASSTCHATAGFVKLHQASVKKSGSPSIVKKPGSEGVPVANTSKEPPTPSQMQSSDQCSASGLIIQAKNDSCNDEYAYAIVLDPSPNSHSRMANRWNHFLPKSPPSNNSSQCYQDSSVPRKPLPTSKEGSSLVDHRKRGPIQRTDSKEKHSRAGDPNASSNGSPANNNAFLEAGNASPEYLQMSPANIRLDDGKGVTLTPLYQKVMDKPYFHLISRNFAKELVIKGGNGAYVIRPSCMSDTPLTITLNSGAHPYHINIRERPDGLFALGKQKKNEKTFSTIDEIVSTYHETPLTLANGPCARLKYSPQKTNNAYVDHVPACRKNQ